MTGRTARQKIAGMFATPPDILLRHRGEVKFVLHLLIFVSSYLLAYLLRFEFFVPPVYRSVIRETLLLLLVAKGLGFFAFGLFRGWWRYVSIRDVFPIASGCAVGSILFAVMVELLFRPSLVPRSIYLIDWGITLLLVLGMRYLIRTSRETLGHRRGGTERSVLIVGAGAAGQMIARELRGNRSLGMAAVGFIDDDPAKIGTRIEGLRVLGGHERIREISSDAGVDEIIVAIPSASPAVVRHIVGHCREVPALLRILPGVGELIDGSVSVRDLRNVRLEDLLSREPVNLDTELLHREITGRVVMVTGAAGSIGSELCRQVARLSPSRLVMFEIGESPLFDLEREMREAFPGLDLVPAIGDIRDRGRVERVVAAHRPSVIFHAAAYKHVPIMEAHPAEAVKTNVLGTRIVADAAERNGVCRFVLVSTDKVVRPANIMGATKRVAEILIQGRNGAGSGTTFVAVRFGNVLDSAGSVIPIFRRQLESTGRLTVTHPEASRYFMLIPEAVGLILQAGSMGRGGEVFMLDMGNPVRIFDLAMNLIRLSGKELGVDAEIVYTGLRPGEKLHEELVIEGEDAIRTSHPKVLKLIGNGDPGESAGVRIERLLSLAAAGDREGVVGELRSLVKGYTPDYRFHGISDPSGGRFPDPLPPAPSPSKSIH